MPEGDTIFRTATTLRRVLRGEGILACRSTAPRLDPARIAGRTVRDVESRGKNLLIHVEGREDEDLVLYTHMKMTGAWHIYRPGESWRKPASGARIVLETRRAIVVCFYAPVVELFPVADIARHPVLSNLGPDPLARDFDAAAARARMRALPDVPIGEALLDQTVIAGIGNVYKSEILFVCRESPFAPVRDLDDGRLDRLVAAACRLLRANVDGHPRVTRSDRRGARHWVYARSGRPCACCGATVRMLRQGDLGRSTYWCPGCQPERRGSGGSGAAMLSGDEPVRVVPLKSRPARNAAVPPEEMGGTPTVERLP